MKYLVYIFCDAGVTTRILVNKMMEIVYENDLPLEIEAHSIANAEEHVKNKAPNLIILGPQVKYLEPKIKLQFAPVEVVSFDTETFASADAATAVKKIINLLRQ